VAECQFEAVERLLEVPERRCGPFWLNLITGVAASVMFVLFKKSLDSEQPYN